MTERRKKRLVFAGLLVSLMGWLVLQSFASELEYERYLRQMLVIDEVETHSYRLEGAQVKPTDESDTDIKVAMAPALGYVSACYVDGDGSKAPVELELLVEMDRTIRVRSLEPQEQDEGCVRDALGHADWRRVALPIEARIRLVPLASE